MSHTFYTSDLHLGHRRVAEIRGFDDVAEHDAAIADAWCTAVRKRDVVWVLGDLAVSNPTEALTLLASLPGEKHLIWGNHDQGHPMHRNAHRKAGQYLEVFASAQAFARKKIDGASVMLSHFPYAGDTHGRDGDRHGEYRLRNDGRPIIHGHTHWSPEVMDDPFVTHAGGTRQFHVGVDSNDLYPVPEAGVVDQLRQPRWAFDSRDFYDSLY